MIADKAAVALGDKLLPHVHRKHEGPPPRVVGVPWFPGQPGVVREAPDGLAELGAHQHQGVVNVVAFLVERSRTETVFWGSEEFLNSDWAVEDVFQKAEVLWF